MSNEFRVWDRLEKKMIYPENQLKNWKDETCDKDNEWDFHEKRYLLDLKGNVIVWDEEHGFCEHILQDGARFLPLMYAGFLWNGRKIWQGDLIKHYVITYSEQRSLPEYVDFKEWDVIEIISEVVFENGCFMANQIKKYQVYDSGCGTKSFAEPQELLTTFPFPTPESEVIDKSDYAEGYVEYQGCLLHKDDLKKLQAFDILGNKFENSEILKRISEVK